MASLQISPEARNDLHAIKKYIADELDNPAADVRVLVRITKAMRRLIDFPDSGDPLSSIIDIPNDYRFVVSGSYLAFYRHEDNMAFIVRILYGKRDYMKILFGESPDDAPEPEE